MKIYNFGNLKVNSFVIEHAKGLIIVDSGYEKDFDRFITKFYKANLNPKNVKFIVLTHCHDDHVGFLNELLQMTEAKLILHPKAVSRLAQGKNPTSHKASNKLVQIVTKLFIKQEQPFPPVDMPERYLIFDNKNKQYLKEAGFNINIAYLGGHTEDSIALELSNKDILCGDVAMNMPICYKYQPLVLEDLEKLKVAWDYMIANCNNIITSHGKIITSDQLKLKRKYLDKIKLYNI